MNLSRIIKKIIYMILYYQARRIQNMEFTAKQIAEFIQGSVVGNENATVNTFAKIEEGKPGAISFLANAKYTNYIYETKSTIVLVDETLKLDKDVECTLIRVKNAYDAVAKLLQLYESMKPKKKGISSLAFIDPAAKIGENCYIGPFVAIAANAVIGDGCVLHPHVTIGEGVTIGEDTQIYSNAVVYHGCKVGSNCILHAGCVIGADGFGFAPTENGYDKIPQIGIVTIEDNVEIGANTCVDRSTMGSTFVRKGVKLDNLIQIAHNVQIGENTVIAAQTGIAGSTIVGKNCVFGGQVGVAGHLKVADKTSFSAQTGLISNVREPGKAYMGTPAIEYRTYLKAYATFKNNGQK